MTKATIVLGLIVATAAASVSAFGCTAEDTIDRARQTRDTDLYDKAEDVAREVLDTEGVDTSFTIPNLMHDGVTDPEMRAQYSNATTLEAATGTLFLEGGASYVGSPGEARQFLSTHSTGMEFHGGNMIDGTSNPQTVRGHMVYHAKEILYRQKYYEDYRKEHGTVAPVETAVAPTHETEPEPAAPPTLLKTPAQVPEESGVNHAG